MDLRKRIVSAAKSGKSYSEVARQFSVDRGTVREYVRRAEAGELAALAFSAVNTYFKRMGISFKKNAIRQEA